MSDLTRVPVVGLSMAFHDALPEFREKYEGTHMAVEVMVPIDWVSTLTLSSTLDVVIPEGAQLELGGIS